jgi:putative SOS response-associated peptidase YedK
LTRCAGGWFRNWAKDIKIGYSLINGKAETVAEKPAFRDAFKSRRCLIPTDGFYE